MTKRSDDVLGKPINHPSFAQAVLTRAQVGPQGARLYGSALRHGSVMRLTIKRSELRRALSEDRHYGTEHLIAISMSEAQWATLISAVGQGGGVPVTLEYYAGKHVADPPEHAGTLGSYDREFTDVCVRMSADLEALHREVTELAGVNRRRKPFAQILERLDRVLMQFQSNLPFVQRQFQENAQHMMDEVRVALHAYGTRLGLSASANTMRLEDGRDDDAGEG